MSNCDEYNHDMAGRIRERLSKNMIRTMDKLGVPEDASEYWRHYIAETMGFAAHLCHASGVTRDGFLRFAAAAADDYNWDSN